MDSENIVNDITKEIDLALKEMGKIEDMEKKEAYSRIVKNLCDSLGVFLNLATEMMPYDFEDDFEDIDNEDMPF